MSAKYVPVTELEFDSIFLEKGWQKTVQPGSKEITYTKNLKTKPHVCVKVYSSVKVESGLGRDCGKDAIRVVAVDMAKNKGLVKVSRVYRVPGWQNRLKERVITVWGMAKSRG